MEGGLLLVMAISNGASLAAPGADPPVGGRGLSLRARGGAALPARSG
jgi:hypothetical protein